MFFGANEQTGLLRGSQTSKVYSHHGIYWFAITIIVFLSGAFLLHLRSPTPGMMILSEDVSSPSFPWQKFLPDGDDHQIASGNYGDNFRKLGEALLLDITGDDELPRPRFVGSGNGQGTFRCKDFKKQWDQLNCFQMTIFMNHLLDLRHKQLGSYLVSLVDKPTKIQKTMEKTKSLGGTEAQDMNQFYEMYGKIPFELVQDFGGGSGAGMQIMCNGTLLLTMGGGGGGGIELTLNDTYDWQGGGGGGVQIYDPDNNNTFASLGGGSGTPNYTANIDEDANVTDFQALWPKVKSTIRDCPRDILHLHGGGGGGGGISVRGQETYLWKYFYFYFEYGDDGNATDSDSENSDSGNMTHAEEMDMNKKYMQQGNHSNQGDYDYSSGGKQKDYCMYIPNEDRRAHCEAARIQSTKSNEQDKAQTEVLKQTTTASQGVASTTTASQDVASTTAASQDVASTTTASQDVASTTTASQDVASTTKAISDLTTKAQQS